MANIGDRPRPVVGSLLQGNFRLLNWPMGSDDPGLVVREKSQFLLATALLTLILNHQDVIGQ